MTVRTAQTGSPTAAARRPALFKLQPGDGATVSATQIIWTTGCTGPDQLASINGTSGYGHDVVAVNRDWDMVPDNTTPPVSPGMLFVIAPNARQQSSACFWRVRRTPDRSQCTHYEEFSSSTTTQRRH
jgi:hypothetical protein